jgi:hypothetical protein
MKTILSAAVSEWTGGVDAGREARAAAREGACSARKPEVRPGMVFVCSQGDL